MSVDVINWVFEHSPATRGRRLVLLSLANHAHEDGTHAFPSVDTMVKETRLTRKAVQSALRKLEADRAIHHVRDLSSGTREYLITGVSGEAVETTPRVVSTRVENVPRGVATPRNRAVTTPEPLREPSVNGERRLRAVSTGNSRDLSYLDDSVVG
jgi:Helix-turn-helix domain